MQRIYALALRTNPDPGHAGGCPDSRNASPDPFSTVPRIPPLPQPPWNRSKNCGDYDGRENKLRKSMAFFADFDPPQIFALRADEILGNERQMVWRSGRALQAKPAPATRSRVRTALHMLQTCRVGPRPPPPHGQAPVSRARYSASLWP